MSEQTRRVAVIGDVGGYVKHLRHALGLLGVTDDIWPDYLRVIQVGDLFGGRADVDVARLVAPHIAAGRWTQLVGNWELFAVGGPVVGRAGREAHRAALDEFAAWHRDGLVQRAEAITSSTGLTGVITHAGIGHAFWMHDLDGEPDPFRIVGTLNSMPLGQIIRPGAMLGCDREPAPGPIWAATAEVYRDWTNWPLAADPRPHHRMAPEVRVVPVPPAPLPRMVHSRSRPRHVRPIRRIAADHRHRPSTVGPLSARLTSPAGLHDVDCRPRGGVDIVSPTDRSPWICPTCAHFIVRPTRTEDTPSHNCDLAGREVNLVVYIDSTQALHIRNGAVTAASVDAAPRRDS